MFAKDCEIFWRVDSNNKKLSYRRETARQLPTWSGGARPSSPLPLRSLATPMCMVDSETATNVRQACRPLSGKRTLRWIGHWRSFKVILIGAGRNPERCVVVMCN